MDKVKSCYERIRVIRGVSYGFISYEQIQDLFDIFQLDNGQQQSVMEMLENEGCCPVKVTPRVRLAVLTFRESTQNCFDKTKRPVLLHTGSRETPKSERHLFA